MLQDQIFYTAWVYSYLSELNDNRYKQMNLLGYGGNYFEWLGLMDLSARVKELQHVSLANGATCFGQPFDFDGLVSQTNRERPSIKMRVFPNPVNDKFRINTDDHSELEATIFNAKGHALKQVRIRSGAEVDIADLPTGLYFLNVKSSSGIKVMRLIKN
ncbi:T9SS type A sorting domain-containing protein [Neolewinella agarilytica]|uniref:Por secretion system C-terminal sorting domain-containing protein n=1 Tax=Neolewinella agarilytica TaxID=478744 RepID=A0A1H9LEW2_9BACT|nr:T9SS type A sorting domain-containing protein [Neolewinella agarilytica]SER10031.1 Por secretion system C-terminal sorting domain-containing protein [Neolewinella agarilytica]